MGDRLIAFLYVQLYKVEWLTVEEVNGPWNFILKGELGPFLTRVNPMGQRPYWPSHMEESFCTFGFGAIIRRHLRTLSLPIHHVITYVPVWFKSMRERQLTLNKIIWRA